MCCLFGLIDYKGNLSYQEREKILRELAISGEVRGTDATGLAWCNQGKIVVKKSSKPAHRFSVCIPKNAKVIMGHTRLTTQGNYHYNRNNHPFIGHCKRNDFALAHNGILYNDIKLRKKYQLPQTKIETDSYIAVQLLEQEKECEIKSIERLGEIVSEGFNSFNFTLLDDCENIYIVKGNNPLAIYHFEDRGFYIYASTEEIAMEAMEKVGVKNIPTVECLEPGTVLKISPNGERTAGHFQMNTEEYSCFSVTDYVDWDITEERPRTEYFNLLLEYAKIVHYPIEDLLELWEYGYDEEEIEEIISEEASERWGA